MQVLFLDDDHERVDIFLQICPTATVVETARDCIARIANHEWDLVCLDHDLGGGVFCDSNREDCGMEVVRWLVRNAKLRELDEKFAAKFHIDLFLVHSHNYYKSHIMVSDLQKAGYKALELAFGMEFLDAVRRITKTQPS